MDQSIFTDKGIIPTDSDLTSALGGAYLLWKEISDYVHEEYPAVQEEWKFPGEKHGWSFRLKDKKRVIVYLLPRDKYFKVALVFGEKAVGEVMNSAVSEQIKSDLEKAKPYVEGRGIRIDIKNKSVVKDIKRLIDIKLEN